MASSSPNTIILKGNPPRGEANSAAAVTPGELLEFTSAGTLQAVSTAGNPAVMIAVEDPYNGVAGTAAIDVDYASGERTRYAIFQRGDEFYALLEAAGTAAIGSLYQANASGQLEAYVGTVAANHAIAMALEAVDNTSGTVAVRLHVQAL